MPNEIKLFLSSPYTWLSFGVAAIIGVWWAKLNPLMSNLSLVFAVVAIAIAVALHPVLDSQPLPIRALWTLFTASTLSLAIYYSLWTSVSPLAFLATTSAAEKPPATVIGGISWKEQYAELRIFIVNHSRADYADLDVVIRPTEPVATWGVVSGLVDPKLTFNEPPTVTPEWIDRTTRRRVAIQLAPLASKRGVRLRADIIPSHAVIEVVLALVSVNDTPHTAEADQVLAVNFADGQSFWFAGPGHSDQVFGPRPTISNVFLKGSYSAVESQQLIATELEPEDRLAGVKLS